MVNISWRLHNIHAASTAHPLEMNILDETNMKHTNTDTKHEHALLHNCRPTHPANRTPRGPELPSQRTHIVCWSTILVRSAGHMATCQCSGKTHQHTFLFIYNLASITNIFVIWNICQLHNAIHARRTTQPYIAKSHLKLQTDTILGIEREHAFVSNTCCQDGATRISSEAQPQAIHM